MSVTRVTLRIPQFLTIVNKMDRQVESYETTILRKIKQKNKECNNFTLLEPIILFKKYQFLETPGLPFNTFPLFGSCTRNHADNRVDRVSCSAVS